MFNSNYDEELTLIQMGMTFNIIHHDFNSNLNALHRQASELRKWGAVNPGSGLEKLAESMSASITYLNEYLNLFPAINPHYKRYSKIHIEGSSIRSFLLSLFRIQLEKTGIKLESDQSFNTSKNIIGYNSTFYPAFINCVENAIYWLDQTKTENPTITLSAELGVFIISDNGPGIKDGNKVFEYGYTTRDEGRGIGLFSAKKILNDDGWDLVLDPYKEGEGATFRILKLES